jgi:hypothetical protein
MGKDHLPGGKFAPGNSAGSAPRLPLEIRLARLETKDALIIEAQSVAVSKMSSLEKDLKDPEITQLHYLTLKAIKTRDFKFIQWLMEMGAGKAPQTIERVLTHKEKREITLKYTVN